VLEIDRVEAQAAIVEVEGERAAARDGDRREHARQPPSGQHRRAPQRRDDADGDGQKREQLVL
jgi:hypothetical protein